MLVKIKKSKSNSTHRPLIGTQKGGLEKDWKEKFYLGSGKTPWLNIGSINLIIHYLKPELGQILLIDETSTNGLFGLVLSSANGVVPNICVEKVFKSLPMCSLCFQKHFSR